MKLLLAASLLFAIHFNTQANAAPLKGDIDIFSLTRTSADGQIVFAGEIKNEVLSVDSEAKTYEVLATQSAIIGTAPASQTVSMRNSDFIATCATSLKGVVETVVVGAGSFQACKVAEKGADYSGFAWFANEALLGLIKQEGTFTGANPHTYKTEWLSKSRLP